MNLDNCLEMQRRAQKLIPGMTQLLSKRPDQFSSGIWPGYFKKAKGIEIWDLDDNHYFDFSISGIGANVLGYSDPDVDAAVKEAIDNGTSSSLNSYEEVELAEVLCQIHPWANKVRFSRTGGEAMAIAIRIARAYTGKDKIAFCGYHGWHDWYLAANLGTENALGEHLLSGLSPNGVPKGLTGTALPFRYNKIEELEQIVNKEKDSLAAIVMEPIRGSEPNGDFLRNIRKIATDNDVILIFDEISVGFRLTLGGAHLLFDVRPDIAVFSKALGNGYPISAIIGISNVMDTVQATFISSTNWTERIGFAAALATINKLSRYDICSHLNKVGQKIQHGWKELAQKHQLSINVNGLPPMSHFTFNDSNPQEMKALFIQYMLREGFLASTLLYVMYAHKEHHIKNYLETVDKVFYKLSSVLKNGDIKSELRGKPSAVGFQRLVD